MPTPKERRWTVMLVPHGAGGSKSVAVSQAFLAGLAGIGSVVALTFLVLGVAALWRGVNITRSRALEHQNRLLAEEIERTRERIGVLRDTMAAFSTREQELRLLAGLAPTDTGAQQAGIGGPVGIWPERDSLASMGPTGQGALAARLDAEALARRASILVHSLNEAYASLARQRVHPILHIARPHEGIDVTAPQGAQIEAPAAGVVAEVAWEEGYGNFLSIDHGNGLVTRYAHCSRILVARGARVKRGQAIALVGSTGLSTGPHLHYEVWVNGKPVDPMKYVLPDAIVD